MAKGKDDRDLFDYSVEELRRLVQEKSDSGEPIDAELLFSDLRTRIDDKRSKQRS